LGSFIAAACQVAAGSDPRETVVKAARAGAKFVVLPAFCLQAAAERRGAIPGRASVPRETLIETASSLAREAGCWLVPGTALVPASGGDGVCHVAWLFSPKGELIGEQAQTHTTREEEAAGWRRSDDLKVFKALGVRIGLVIGVDVWIPEVSRILTLEGADVLVAPMAMPVPYSEDRQIAGLWQEEIGRAHV